MIRVGNITAVYLTMFCFMMVGLSCKDPLRPPRGSVALPEQKPHTHARSDISVWRALSKIKPVVGPIAVYIGDGDWQPVTQDDYRIIRCDDNQSLVDDYIRMMERILQGPAVNVPQNSAYYRILPSRIVVNDDRSGFAVYPSTSGGTAMTTNCMIVCWDHKGQYHSPAVPLPKGYSFKGDMKLVGNTLVLKCIPSDDEKPIIEKRVTLDDLAIETPKETGSGDGAKK